MYCYRQCYDAKAWSKQLRDHLLIPRFILYGGRLHLEATCKKRQRVTLIDFRDHGTTFTS